MSRSNRSRGGTGRVWNAAFLLAVGVGLLCANVQWGLQRWTAAALTVAVMASLVAAAMLADGGVRAIPKMAASGLVAGFVGSAAAALVTTFDVLGLLVVLVLVATSPAVHVGVRVAWRTLFAAPVPGSSRSQQQAGDQARHVPRAPRASVVQPSLAGIADLDDADLCRAWRESFAPRASTSWSDASATSTSSSCGTPTGWPAGWPRAPTPPVTRVLTWTSRRPSSADERFIQNG